MSTWARVFAFSPYGHVGDAEEHCGQRYDRVCNANMDGRDIVCVMPTGGGKSLCFQLPALCQTGKTCGITIVVSPLIALMNDQVTALKRKNIDVELWNSENSGEEAHAVTRRLNGADSGRALPAMLYVTPEKLCESNSIKNVLSRLYNAGRLARFFIDEAHCISTWGREFRDAVRLISTISSRYSG